MGHWNGDRDCESAHLIGCLLGVEGFPATEIVFGREASDLLLGLTQEFRR